MTIDNLLLFKAVNKCKTVDELVKTFEEMAQNVVFDGDEFWPSDQIDAIWAAADEAAPYENVTTECGIRQQLMHIMYYENRMHLL